MKYEIEVTRNGCTPAEFLAYVRRMLRAKQLRHLASDLDLGYFRSGSDQNFYYHDDPEKPCKAEKSVSKPYEMQTYVLNWDGTQYNEICEFEFDDEKHGHGYYFLLNTVAEEPAQEAAEADQTAEKLEHARQTLENRTDRSAWDKGVTEYALELLEELAVAVRDGCVTADDLNRPGGKQAAMLNGADGWKAYSWGGCSLIYNSDIAERLCSPSELKRTRNGERRPNSREEWLDVQARALSQAAARAVRAIAEG